MTPPLAHSLYPESQPPTGTSSSDPASPEPSSPVDLSIGMGNGEDKSWDKYIRWCPRESGCGESAEEHWHCEECGGTFREKETAGEHAAVHEQQAIITDNHYIRVLPGDEDRACPPDCLVQNCAEHYHCDWDSCGETIMATPDKPFRRLEHYRMHDFTRRLPLHTSSSPYGMGVASVTSVDAMFKRKRGRPPKNRVIEVWNDYLPVSSSSHDSPQAIFTSFKLSKSSPPPPPAAPSLPVGVISGVPYSSLSPFPQPPNVRKDLPLPNSNSVIATNPTSTGGSSSSTLSDTLNLDIRGGTIMLPISGPILANPPQPQAEVLDGFHVWNERSTCPDQLCPHLRRRHYHCSHPRCLYVTTNAEVLLLHSQDFHDNTPIPEGFLAIDRNIDCRLPSCQSNKVNKHFHCVRCSYSFVRYQTLETHAEKHQLEDSSSQSPTYIAKQRPDSPIGSSPASSSGGNTPETPTKSQVIKSSGIFYPLSPFPVTPVVNSRPTNVMRNEAGALVTPIPPPTTKPQAVPTFTLPVTNCMTITGRKSPVPVQSSVPAKSEVMDQGDEEPEEPDSKPVLSPHPPLRPDDVTLSQLLISPKDEKPMPRLSAEWLLPDHHPLYGADHCCGRPFCKLKKKDHFHCQVCNQAFSEQDKLRPHLLKHTTSPGSLHPGSPLPDTEDESPVEVIKDEEPSTEQPSSELNSQPFSPNSPSSSSSNSIQNNPTQLTSNPSPQPLSSGQVMQQQPQFPSPLVYTQAPGFHGLPSPFGHPLGMAGIFQNTLPRLLTPSTWPMHPALAAMAHPAMMLQGVRPNGDISPSTPASIPSPGIRTTSLANHTEPNHIVPSSLSTSPHLALLGKRLGQEDFCTQEAKKIRPSHTIRLLKDEPVPEGYVRFRFNEDCQYPHCGYREHQTHFHCMRKDCGYSFCDKTRFVQHTARHERLDTLMGGDFQQFRSNVPCGRPNCAYSSLLGQQQNKASHFHCLKCDFVCTDTNKVVAHRRQHQKRDSINAAGFEKFTPSQPCSIPGCNHNQKQTHYHCLRCQYVVLGLSQMSAHKFRHLDLAHEM